MKLFAHSPASLALGVLFVIGLFIFNHVTPQQYASVCETFDCGNQTSPSTDTPPPGGGDNGSGGGGGGSGRPIGYLNTGTNMCTAGIGGWACNGSSTVRVDFYNGPYAGSSSNFIGEVTANKSGETAIGQFCSGTSNHRFTFPIPAKFRDNKAHHVYGYINIGDNQIHQMGNQGQTFTCTASTSTTTKTSSTPSSTGAKQATLHLILGLPGIGFNAVGGAAPKHLTRTVTIQLYDASVTNPGGPGTKPIAEATGSVTYDNGTDANAGYFVSTIPIVIPLDSSFAKCTNNAECQSVTTACINGLCVPQHNQYQVLVEVPQYLYKLADNAANDTQVFTLTSGISVTPSPLILSPGDILTTGGNKNILDYNDYTQLASCFHDTSLCTKTPDSVVVADLDDNGALDLADFNLFVRSMYQLQQAQTDPPACNGLSCKGD